MRHRDRRALLLGAGICAVAWLALRGVPDALAGVNRLEEALVQRSDLLLRARSRLAGSGSLASSIAAHEEAARALPRLLLVGTDQETASVDLMTRLRSRLDTLPVALHEFGADRRDVRSGALDLASISITVETDFEGLLRFVQDLEADSVLAVESLNVTAMEPDDRAPSVERLRATLVVSGWHHGGQSAGAEVER